MASIVSVSHVKYTLAVATSSSDSSIVPSAALPVEFLLTLLLHRAVFHVSYNLLLREKASAVLNEAEDTVGGPP